MEYTQKLGLLIPDMADELSAERQNWDRLDDVFSGAIWVSPGVVPDETTLFDGALVAELNTGIVWRAQRNMNTGIYEKKFLKYPWMITAERSAAYSTFTSATWKPVGFNAVVASHCVNSDMSDITGEQIVLPVDGLYRGWYFVRWDGGTGLRAICARFSTYSGQYDYFNTQVDQDSSSNPTYIQTVWQRYLLAGTQLNMGCYQGGATNTATLTLARTAVTLLGAYEK